MNSLKLYIACSTHALLLIHNVHAACNKSISMLLLFLRRCIWCSIDSHNLKQQSRKHSFPIALEYVILPYHFPRKGSTIPSENFLLPHRNMFSPKDLYFFILPTGIIWYPQMIYYSPTISPCAND